MLEMYDLPTVEPEGDEPINESLSVRNTGELPVTPVEIDGKPISGDRPLIYPGKVGVVALAPPDPNMARAVGRFEAPGAHHVEHEVTIASPPDWFIHEHAGDAYDSSGHCSASQDAAETPACLRIAPFDSRMVGPPLLIPGDRQQLTVERHYEVMPDRDIDRFRDGGTVIAFRKGIPGYGTAVETPKTTYLVNGMGLGTLGHVDVQALYRLATIDPKDSQEKQDLRGRIAVCASARGPNSAMRRALGERVMDEKGGPRYLKPVDVDEKFWRALIQDGTHLCAPDHESDPLYVTAHECLAPGEPFSAELRKDCGPGEEGATKE